MSRSPMKKIIPGGAILFKTENEETHNSVYNESLKKLDLKCHTVSPLSFKFLDLEKLAGWLFSPEKFGGLIFTSPRSINAMSKALEGRQAEWISLRAQWNSRPIFTIGNTTSQLAESLLGLNNIGKDAGNSENLSTIIKQVVRPGEKPLLFPCGKLKRETLPNILQEAGIDFQVITVYATSPHPNLKETLQEIIQSEKGLPEYMVYFSPSGVEFTTKVFEDLQLTVQQIKFVAIGSTTAAALRAKGLTVHCVASKPTADSLAEAISQARTRQSDPE